MRTIYHNVPYSLTQQLTTSNVKRNRVTTYKEVGPLNNIIKHICPHMYEGHVPSGADLIIYQKSICLQCTCILDLDQYY